jgi:plasmid maintenance system killer protein
MQGSDRYISPADKIYLDHMNPKDMSLQDFVFHMGRIYHFLDKGIVKIAAESKYRCATEPEFKKEFDKKVEALKAAKKEYNLKVENTSHKIITEEDEQEEKVIEVSKIFDDAGKPLEYNTNKATMFPISVSLPTSENITPSIIPIQPSMDSEMEISYVK